MDEFTLNTKVKLRKEFIRKYLLGMVNTNFFTKHGYVDKEYVKKTAIYLQYYLNKIKLEGVIIGHGARINSSKSFLQVQFKTGKETIVDFFEEDDIYTIM